jgi:hypothetical protein
VGFTLCEVLNFEKFGFQSSRIRRIVPARDHLQFKMAAAMRSVVLNSTGVMGFLMLSCCAMMMMMMMMIRGSDAQTTYTTFAESQYSNQFAVAWQPSNVWVVNDVLELAVTKESGEAAIPYFSLQDVRQECCKLLMISLQKRTICKSSSDITLDFISTALLP